MLKKTNSGYPNLCDRIFLFFIYVRDNSVTEVRVTHFRSRNSCSGTYCANSVTRPPGYGCSHLACSWDVSGFKPPGDSGRRNPCCHVGARSCPGVLRGHLTRAVLQAHSAASGLRQIAFLDIQSVFPQTPPRSCARDIFTCKNSGMRFPLGGQCDD